MQLSEENPCGEFHDAHEKINIRICKLFKFNVYVISEPISGFSRSILNDPVPAHQQNYDVCENSIQTDQDDQLSHLPVCQKIHPFIDTQSLLGKFTEPGKLKYPGFKNENAIIPKYSGFGKRNARFRDQCYPFMEIIEWQGFTRLRLGDPHAQESMLSFVEKVFMGIYYVFCFLVSLCIIYIMFEL